MKLYAIRSLGCLTVLPFLLVGSLHAQNAIRYEAQPGSKIKIEGTSTIHDWKVDCAMIGGFMELEPSFDADLKTPTPATKVEVSIPVRQLKASEGKRMDNVMYEHLKLNDNPLVKYQLLKLTPKAGAPSQFDAQGALTISGVTRTNTMPVTFERMDKTKIKVKGNTTVKMTDYGVQPPAPSILGMSLIRTGDDVKLTFEWLLAQPEKTVSAK
jgi:polyisoprenoid-binding protein YceI